MMSEATALVTGLFIGFILGMIVMLYILVMTRVKDLLNQEITSDL